MMFTPGSTGGSGHSEAAASTYASLPESSRPGIVLGGTDPEAAANLCAYEDVVTQVVPGGGEAMFNTMLDALTEELQRQAPDCELTRSRRRGPGVADWQLKAEQKGFTVVVECIARQHNELLLFEARRFIWRPFKLSSRVGSTLVVIGLTVGVPALARYLLTNDDAAGSLTILVLAGAVVTVLAGIWLYAQGDPKAHKPTDSYRAVSAGADSASRALFECAKRALALVSTAAKYGGEA